MNLITTSSLLNICPSHLQQVACTNTNYEPEQITHIQNTAIQNYPVVENNTANDVETHNKVKEFYVVGPWLHFQCFEHGDNNYIQCEYHSSKRLNENN
jgi:hypothetical protein